MKTSIFDMTFTLPPIVEMSEVEKDSWQPNTVCCSYSPLFWPFSMAERCLANQGRFSFLHLAPPSIDNPAQNRLLLRCG
jgi:hypothetical protein